MEGSTFSLEAFKFDDADRSFFEDNADFHRDKWAIAPNGGAIVMAHSNDLLPENKGYSHITIYDSTGIMLNRIPLDVEENIKALYITPEECVVILFANAELQTFNLRGDQLGQYEFNPKREEGDAGGSQYESIISCSFWSSGFFLCTYSKKVFICDDIATLNIRLFAKTMGTPNIVGCTAVAPDPNRGTGPVLYGWSGSQIILVQQDNVQSFTLQYDGYCYNIEQIVFSPSRKYCLIHSGEWYFFMNVTLSEMLLRINFQDIDPRQVIWCGDDTALLIANRTIAMIGTSELVLQWNMISPVAAITEVDGARIFAKDGVYLLRAFNNSATQFGLWNLKSLPVKLFNCMLDVKYLAVQEPMKDFTLDELEKALNGLDEAALFFTQYDQRLPLLTAISRLMAIIDVPKDDGTELSDKLMQLRDFDKYADHLSMLRICEQLFHAPYNIPITYAQFNNLTPSILLKRLCNRSLHFEAFRIANFMGIDSEFIAAHWANCLIRTDLPSEEIKNKLLEMDQPTDLIDLATTAFDIENEDVAITLLDTNTAKSRGVPLLLKREKWDEALAFAISSNDMSLILYAFEEARKQERDTEMQEIFNKNQIARDLWVKMLKGDEKIEFLKTMGKEDLEMFKYLLTYNEGEDELRASLKKNKNQLVNQALSIYKAVEPLRKWLRNKKNGIEEPPPPPKESIFSKIFGKVKEAKEAIDQKRNEKNKENEENKKKKNNKKGKKGKKDDSDDDDDDYSEDEKPKKGKKGKKNNKKGKKGKKDDSDEDEDDESSEEEKPKKGKKNNKKGKKGKKDESDEDESSEEEEKSKKKGKKGKKEDEEEKKEGEEEPKKEGEEEPKKEGDEEPKKEGAEEEKKEGAEEPKKEGDEEKKEGDDAKPPVDAKPPEEKPPEEEKPDANLVPIEPPQTTEETGASKDGSPDQPPPKPIPPKDEFDLMTPLEIFEQIVLYNNSAKILEAQKILQMTPEESYWKRLFTALKFNNMDVIKLLIQEAKPDIVMELIDYCKELKNQRAVDYLRGLDPDAEAEKKKKKFKK
ncbi:hypothetical protein GPJ56_005288 [Histomonas meleagridis]|uniref:uncharacterized protein n=1 Tax=Histomonas meleagridis TaxID=135588 RepID=UPI003559577F|nr:hypothetical protein GPJ56_005288 [Histomonas meleagridis]KAH0802137.1 hypothetical protein GO595_005218 [Histomonas meleagridis]